MHPRSTEFEKRFSRPKTSLSACKTVAHPSAALVSGVIGLGVLAAGALSYALFHDAPPAAVATDHLATTAVPRFEAPPAAATRQHMAPATAPTAVGRVAVGEVVAPSPLGEEHNLRPGHAGSVAEDVAEQSERFQKAVLTMNSDDALQLRANLLLASQCQAMLLGGYASLERECRLLEAASPAMRAMLHSLAAAGRHDAELVLVERSHRKALAAYEAAFFSGRTDVAGDRMAELSKLQERYSQLTKALNGTDVPPIPVLSVSSSADATGATSPRP